MYLQVFYSDVNPPIYAKRIGMRNGTTVESSTVQGMRKAKIIENYEKFQATVRTRIAITTLLLFLDLENFNLFHHEVGRTGKQCVIQCKGVSWCTLCVRRRC